jgi:rhodanese-related sulfurtransferase
MQEYHSSQRLLGAFAVCASAGMEDTIRHGKLKTKSNFSNRKERAMKKLLTTVTRKSLCLMLSVAFSVALAASVSAVEIPKGKTGDDYVKEAKGHVEGISAAEAKKLKDSTNNIVLLDIRSFEEFKQDGWIKGRTVLPHGLVIFKIREIVPNKDVPIIVYCKKGKRSALIAYQLQQMGYANVKYLEGGMLNWKRKGFPAVSSGISEIAQEAVVPKGDMPAGKSADDFVGEADKVVKAVSPSEVKQKMAAKNAFLLDIRSVKEIKTQGAIDGALVMEHGKVMFNIKKKVHDANSPIFIVCKKGGRSALIAQQMQEMGYKDVHHIKGGIVAWKAAGLPVK